MSAATIRVRELRSPVSADVVGSLNGCTHLQWRDILGPDAIETLARWLRSNRAVVRLSGAAAEQLDTLLRLDCVERMAIEGARLQGAATGSPRVVELALFGFSPAVERLLAAFPNVRELRVDARGERFDVRWLAQTPKLAALSLCAARVVNASSVSVLEGLSGMEIADCSGELEPLLRHRGIANLRLARGAEIRSVAALAGQSALRRLTLEDLTHLESLSPLESIPNLQSLELRRLWQFGVDDAACITRIGSLRELTLDIGGKRKNVEITKRLGLPEPKPFCVKRYEPESGNKA